MNIISLKTTISAVATAATLMTSAILPTAQASAEVLIVPPIGPNICLTKPWLCGPGGLELPPPGPGPLPPPPPPAPPAPSSGLSKDQMLGLGLVGGVIAGAAIANATRPREIMVQPAGNGNAHLAYCLNRFKSYRVSDNSYQPYHGPRKQCISPYM